MAVSEKEIMEKYTLSQEKVDQIKDTVIKVMAGDRIPSKNPLVVVVGGQSGAGKTALINYTTQISASRDFVVIDNDYFRSFHPQADEIRKLYPDFYTAATDQIGLGITSDVISYFKDNKYDIILHQTLKSNRIADDAMTKFKEAGYTVGVRVLAVPYVESKMSQIERCIGQTEKLGFCRHVRKVDHDTAVEGLPPTVDYIEKTGKYDFIEVFKRGRLPADPVRVYSHINPQTEQETLATLSNCQKVSHENNFFGFDDARDAVLTTRAQEEARVIKEGIEDRIEEAEQSHFNSPETQIHIDELKQYLEMRQNATGSQSQEEQDSPTDTLSSSCQEQ